MTKAQATIIAATRAMHDKTGNLPPMPVIFHDYAATIARNAAYGGTGNGALGYAVAGIRARRPVTVTQA